MRGKLIFLFGIDGSGKSTILKMLENSGLDNTVYTSCLTNAVFEEELYRAERKLHFSRGNLFSREFKHMLHIGSVIYKMFDMVWPLLDSGTNVILDRYVICIKLFTDIFLEPSYSCLSRALDCMPIPDLGIYFDVDVDIAIQRIAERNRRTGTLPHYSESMESLIKKKAGYEVMIPNEKYSILRIDANQDVDEVYSSTLRILNEICVPHNVAN
ncbi:MAG: deoxynucleoside kinase [Clostridiales bacterium]|nr:deoxynucleoside kinase [Clostridiales bacterium]